MYDDMILFIKIIECGNFSKAAKILNMYPSKISRRMTSLEEQLGAQLFKKNVPEMELTEYGKAAYELFSSKIHSLLNSVDEYNIKLNKITGQLNILLPPLFAKVYINHNLYKLTDKYPDLQLKISYLVLNTSDLDSYPFDIAVSRLPVSRPLYTQKVLYRTKLVLYATRDYIARHGMPETLDDLSNHNLITLLSDGDLNSGPIKAISEKTLEEFELKNIKQKIIHNSSLAAEDILFSGAGLTFVLDYDASIKNQSVRVLPDYYFGEVKFFLINSNFEGGKKYEIFTNFIVECLENKDLT